MAKVIICDICSTAMQESVLPNVREGRADFEISIGTHEFFIHAIFKNAFGDATKTDICKNCLENSDVKIKF